MSKKKDYEEPLFEVKEVREFLKSIISIILINLFK
jgi:hypothetical protein